MEEFHLLWMHFHNIYLLQRSIISEKYQVFIKFLRMAESQNTLVTLQFYLLKMNKKNCNQTSKQGIYFSTRLNPNWTKFYPKTYSIQILEWKSGSIYSLLNFRLSRKKIYHSDQEKLLIKSTTKQCYMATGLDSNFDPFHSNDGSQC